MEKLLPDTEYLTRDEQYLIASNIGLVQLMAHLVETRADEFDFSKLDLDSRPTMRSQAAKNLTMLAVKDVSMLAEYIEGSSKKNFTQENHVHEVSNKLGFTDEAGNLTDYTTLAFHFLTEDDEIYNEIFRSSDLDRHSATLELVNRHLLAYCHTQLDGKYDFIELLIYCRHEIEHWIGEYDPRRA